MAQDIASIFETKEKAQKVAHDFFENGNHQKMVELYEKSLNLRGENYSESAENELNTQFDLIATDFLHTLQAQGFYTDMSTDTDIMDNLFDYWGWYDKISNERSKRSLAEQAKQLAEQQAEQERIAREQAEQQAQQERIEKEQAEKQSEQQRKELEKERKKAERQAKKALNKDVPFLHSKPSENFHKNNTKIVQKSTEWDLSKEAEKLVSVGKTGAKKEITTTIKLKAVYDDKKVSLSSNYNFTHYDRLIQDSVATLYQAGNEVITDKLIYQTYNGKATGKNVSQKALDKVAESIEKAGLIMVEIDYTAEAQARKKDIKDTTYRGRLLAYEEIKVTTGGETIKGYKILTSPILYRYAQMNGQIYTIPAKVLHTSQIVDSTKQNMLIKDFLIKQVEDMKSNSFKNRNDIIKLETLYTRLEINEQSTGYRAEKQRVRATVEKLLYYWKTEGEYIKDYSQYKKGTSITGYQIELLNKDVIIDVKPQKIKKNTDK